MYRDRETAYDIVQIAAWLKIISFSLPPNAGATAYRRLLNAVIDLVVLV
ncbi:hypothetical protein NMG60_11007195 [Bertholletia excelsa]